jgi:hypothetical protein
MSRYEEYDDDFYPGELEEELEYYGKKEKKNGFQSWVDQQGGWGPVLLTILIAVGVFILVWWIASLSSAGSSASSGAQPIGSVGGSATWSQQSSGATGGSFGQSSASSSAPPPTSTGTNATGTSTATTASLFGRGYYQPQNSCGSCRGAFPQGRSPALATDAFGQTSPDVASGVPALSQTR